VSVARGTSCPSLYVDTPPCDVWCTSDNTADADGQNTKANFDNNYNDNASSTTPVIDDYNSSCRQRQGQWVSARQHDTPTSTQQLLHARSAQMLCEEIRTVLETVDLFQHKSARRHNFLNPQEANTNVSSFAKASTIRQRDGCRSVASQLDADLKVEVV
jgi:hypothetical protein